MKEKLSKWHNVEFKKVSCDNMSIMGWLCPDREKKYCCQVPDKTVCVCDGLRFFYSIIVSQMVDYITSCNLLKSPLR